MQNRWSVEDEGELTDLLGIDFSFDDGAVTLAQPRYIDNLCKTYEIDVSAVNTDNALLPHHKCLPQYVEDALSHGCFVHTCIAAP